jgi:hypothetical protein
VAELASVVDGKLIEISIGKTEFLLCLVLNFLFDFFFVLQLAFPILLEKFIANQNAKFIGFNYVELQVASAFLQFLTTDFVDQVRNLLLDQEFLNLFEGGKILNDQDSSLAELFDKVIEVFSEDWHFIEN